MSENSAIWLKPKPIHIDENFEDFLVYMMTATDKISDLYIESVRLLQDRVDILINERFEAPIYRHVTDIETRQFNVRLCSAWLLAADQRKDYNKKKLVLLTLINNLIQILLRTDKIINSQETLTYKSIDKLLYMAISVVLCKIPETLNMSWTDITKYTLKKEDNNLFWSVDKFLNSFLKNEFKEFENSYFEDNGLLFVEKGEISIVPVSKDQFAKTVFTNSLVRSSFIPSCNLCLYTDKKSQIKESKKGDVEIIEDCVDSIITEWKNCFKLHLPKFLKCYSDKEIISVEIIKINAKNFNVKTIDPEYEEIKGKLVLDNNLNIFNKNYPFEMWAKALPIGSRIKARYIEETRSFSITEQFIDYIQDDLKVGDNIHCKYYRDIDADEGYYEFVTDDGYIVFVPLTPEQEDEIDEDGYIVAKVFEHNYEKSLRGCIKASFIAAYDDHEEFNAEEALQELVNDFVYKIGDIDMPEVVEANVLNTHFIKEMCYTFNMMQSRESNPQNRYRLLCVIKLLSEMARFERESKYITYLSKYIKTLILFAQAEKDENQCIKNIEVPEGLENNETIASGTDILNILGTLPNFRG